MLQLQQRVLDVNMSPNQPYFLGQNHRAKALQPQEIQPRSYSVQVQNNRSLNFASYEGDLRNSLLVQSHLEYQEKLKHLMTTQNQILKQQLMEIENKQLKFQNEILQQHVQKMQQEFETTVKQMTKQKLPSLQSQVETQRTFQLQENLQKQKRKISLNAEDSYIDKEQLNQDSINENSLYLQKTSEMNEPKFPQSFRIDGDFEYQVIKKKEKEAPQLKNRRRIRKFRKIKKFFIAVLAFVRLSKSLKRSRSKKLKSLRDKFEIVKNNLLKYPENQILEVLNNYILNIFDDFFLELNKQSFIKHCETPDYDTNAEKNIVFRQELIIKLSQTFFTNLEIKTRPDNFPPLIVQLMYLSLFHSQNPKASLFVAKRTNFYMKNSIKIPILQEKLIISEYFFFRFIILYMLKIFNNTLYRNQIHEKLCKFFATVIASFVQILYMDYFEDLKFVNKINVKLYQRKIVLDSQLKATMIEDDDIDQKETLILGLHERNQFESIFQSQINWITSIGQIFNKIVSNIYNLIQN